MPIITKELDSYFILTYQILHFKLVYYSLYESIIKLVCYSLYESIDDSTVGKDLK